MWYLTSETTTRETRVIYLFPLKPRIIIGRSADAQICNFAIPYDLSVSKIHAALCIYENALYIKDLGSWNGTYINNSGRIEENVVIKLNSSDVVKFGKLSCVWKVHEINFVTCTCTLIGEDLKNLKILLLKLGGTFKREWDETCTYLTMPGIKLKPKVVLALIQNSNIVTVQYWSKCLEAVTNNNPLPNANDFIPQLLDSELDKENVSFLPNKKRSSILAGKVVIFFSRRQLDIFKTMLIKSCATPLLLSETKITKSALCEDNVIVIQYDLNFPSQDIQTPKYKIQEITNYLKSKGKRAVESNEIAFAILYCSTQKYCNPDFMNKKLAVETVQEEAVPSKRKHSADIDDDDLFVNRENKKPAVENDIAGSNILDSYDNDDDKNVCHKKKDNIDLGFSTVVVKPDLIVKREPVHVRASSPLLFDSEEYEEFQKDLAN